MDFAINDCIAEHLSHPILDVIFECITFLGDAGWFWIALTVTFLCFKETRRYGVAMAISLVFSTLFTNILLKPLINRPRPYELRPEIVLKTDPPHDASFPSGHTSASFAAALALFRENKRLGTPAVILAALIGYSRLYFYLHFFTDVLGGTLIGTLTAVISYCLTPLAMKGVTALEKTIAAKKASRKKHGNS
ncbi:MAG: phosphatase PAP2 family protein [Clostridia bacterium]|nr:phosphatase PAP2 family protein [Clostridia bacterium]